MWKLLRSDRKLQLITKESHAIRQCFNSYAQRKHWRMAAKLAVVEKDGMSGSVRRLKASGHFASVQRVAVPVGVTGDKHRGRIGCALPYLVIGRIFCEGSEIVRVIRGAEFIFPDVRIVEKVVTQHVQH